MDNEKTCWDGWMFPGGCCEAFFRGRSKRSETPPDRGDGAGKTQGCQPMMGPCIKGCRWLLLAPVVIGIGLLLLGYYLDARVMRIVWMVLAGFPILLGTLGFLIMSTAGSTRGT